MNEQDSPLEELQLNKLECAHRQLETAIELFFRNGDPVSIHTLACAAYNVIRDVNKSRDGRPMYAKEQYAQLHNKPSVSTLNQPENFFKHADRDPDEELTFFPRFTECLLVDACEKYHELTNERVPCFLGFTMWFMCQAPEKFNIPEAWREFVSKAQELHQRDDRDGFHKLLTSHLDELETDNSQ